MAKKNKKVVRYRRPINLNVGMIIFAIIFVYMAFSVYTYMKKDKIQFYEVVEGDIVNDKSYTGVILREENVENTDRAGYISYYVREGKRASVGTSIYSIDETGSLASYLEDNPDANVSLTDANLADVKRQLTNFSMTFQNMDFTSVYDTQYALEASVLEYVNFNAMDNLDDILSQTGISFQQIKASKAGVVSYAIDGYETLIPTDVDASVFNKQNYSRAITKSGQLIEKSAPVYKLVTSDQWSVIFPISDTDMSEYNGKTSLPVTFSNHDLTLNGDFSTIIGKDGATYGKLDFSQYMVQFVSERFVEFTLGTEKTPGLKIPTSSVTTKNFYLVPIDYMGQGGDSSNTGFMKESYSESGTSVEFTPATIYYANDEYYYVDMGANSPLQGGDYLVKPNSTDRYQLGSTASLEGVYNINKGYAVFKQIDILKSNEEYYIVRKNMNYGLNVYDHIVLNAGSVYEGELIYQ